MGESFGVNTRALRVQECRELLLGHRPGVLDQERQVPGQTPGRPVGAHALGLVPREVQEGWHAGSENAATATLGASGIVAGDDIGYRAGVYDHDLAPLPQVPVCALCRACCARCSP